MSGATVPYRLRPHKAVDRRLFIELLTRFERWLPLDRHAYVSMAGYTMEDQKLVHRFLGITRLLAFDLEQQIVDRQVFNRPTQEAKCVCAAADRIASDIENEVIAAGIPDAAGYVVWLDYTDPASIAQQLREFGALVGQLAAGDLVRVTVNAARSSWDGIRRPDDKLQGPALKEELRERTLRKLNNKLGDLLPPGIKAETLDDEGLASALAGAFGVMASRQLPGTSALTLEPLSIIRYADGLQMLSITAAVVEREKVVELRQRLQLDAWPFASASWSDVKLIAVPDLTIRERLYLERNAFKNASDIQDETGISVARSNAIPVSS